MQASGSSGRTDGADAVPFEPSPVLTGILYFLLSELSLLTPLEGQGTALFWLGAGLSLGVLARLPPKKWPLQVACVLVACLGSNAIHEIPFWLSVVFGLANIVEPALGALLFRQLSKASPTLPSTQFLHLALAALLSCACGSAIGTAGVWAAGLTMQPLVTLKLWYVTDLLGGLLLAPFVFVWWPRSTWATGPLRRSGGVEGWVLLAALAIAGYVTFWSRIGYGQALLSLYLHLGLLLVLALRLGTRGASLGSLVLGLFAVLGTVRGHGPFIHAASSLLERMTALQSYLGVTTAAGLIPALLLTERVAAASSLSAREREVAAIFRSLGEAVLVTDRTGRVAYLNRAAEQLLGVEAGQAQGTPFGSLAPLEGLLQGEDVTSRVLTEGAVVRQPDVRHLLRSDGSEVWVSVTGAPVRDAAGELHGVAIVVTDETQQQAHRAKLADTERQLAHAQKIRALGDLAAGIAHDFNNLLTAIIGSAYLLEDAVDAEDKELARDILDAAERARQLTNQLAVFNRKERVVFAPVDLNRTVSELQRILDRVLGEDITLEIRQAPRPAVIMGDRGQLEQVLVNLAVNARDAMPVGGKLTIWVEEERLLPAMDGPVVRLLVEDTGTGMDELTQERVFEPFFTTKEAGVGTGLGLATVAMIATAHDATVTLHSKLGVGTTFSLEFPGVEAGEAKPHRASSRPARGRGECILLVDDNEILRHSVARLLERDGYRVVLADGSLEALALSNRNKIDLLLTDVVMPTMNGVLLHQEVQRRLGPVPVLFMSGYALDVLAERVGSVGSAEVLRKPFGAQELAGAVSRSLDLAAIRDEAPQPSSAPPPS